MEEQRWMNLTILRECQFTLAGSLARSSCWWFHLLSPDGQHRLTGPGGLGVDGQGRVRGEVPLLALQVVW
jgi:hypothetical protein